MRVSGLVYYDGMNTAVGAQELGSALSAIGYANTTYTDGRSAEQAWNDGLGDAVFFVWGHGNAGQISTDQTGPGPYDREYLLAVYGLIPQRYDYTSNIHRWSDYLPYVDVDDMRLAIFAGCYTANVSPDFGSFGQIGKDTGVDSVIGFTDLLAAPANCGNDCLHYGNYFWSRFGVYVQNGDTVEVALSKAGYDHYIKEGSYWGFDKYKIEGALANPGDVRLTPAAYGYEYDSQPVGYINSFYYGSLGTGPSGIDGLTITSEQPFIIGNRQVWDYETTQGISYRLDAKTSELLWLTAPASTTGQGELTEEEARRAAVDFASRYISWFEESDGLVTTSRPHHLDSDNLFGYSWRISTASGPGPRWVDIEVDRRTGAIVHFSQAVASPSTTTLTVSQAEAIGIAQEAVGAATTVVSAVSEVWNRPIWTVTLNREGDSLTPDFLWVVVDGQSGEVTRQAAT